MAHLSVAHVGALIVTAAVSVLLVGGARRYGGRFSHPARRVLAVVILAGFVAEQAVYAARGIWSARVNLPLQLTDAVTVVTVVALWRPRPLLVELVFFWAFAATVQALATPDLGETFPDALYFTYFMTHSGAFAAACLLVLGERRVPRRGSAVRVFAITAAFAVLAAAGTLATGGNYMFLRRKPVGGSLLDVMGPWPWYIPAAAALGLVLFVALEAAVRAYPGLDEHVR
jgi:hypothetical integral membrane protein (TIGR02206 family)